MKELIGYWDAFEKQQRRAGRFQQAVRALCCGDLFYLLVRACGRVDMLRAWVYERVREVEAEPDGYLDLWAREHFKSSVITFGRTIQDVLNDPEITVGLFSHTRPIAKGFLRQIMREFEGNRILNAAFPDILWGPDLRQAPKWSEDDGIIVRRASNPNEATIEAWGLVDGQPTSKHFALTVYDDVVVRDSVTTPEMIEKTMSRLEESYNLGKMNGARRFAGTRWHFNDAYATIVARNTAKLRFHPGTEDGTEEGAPVLLTPEQLADKRRDMGPYTFAAQILLNPKADALQGFRREWLRYYTKIEPKGMNGYILVDSANSKRRESDYTSMWVVLLGSDANFYAADLVRDRLNLTERVERLFTLHRKWIDAGVKLQQIRWERYGMMADIEAIKREQENQNYRFDVTEVHGQTGKDDRIKRLIPIFEQGKFYLMKSLHVTDWEKNTIDLVHTFVEQEYFPFPVSLHKDMLDALSRIVEPGLTLAWPKQQTKQSSQPAPIVSQPQTAWMA